MAPRDGPDDVVSIEVGRGVSRRRVLKQLGAAGSVVGAAGCLSREDDAPAYTETPTGTPDETTQVTQTPIESPTRTPTETRARETTEPPAETPDDDPDPAFEFERYPAVAPPDWQASDTQSGSGDTDRTAVFVYRNSKNPFFVPIVCGFHDALDRYGWSGGAVAVETDFGGQPAVQAALIELEIDQTLTEGDVLVTSIPNSETFNYVIHRALDNDIVVVNAHTSPNPDTWTHEFMMHEAEGENFDGGFSYRDQPTIIPHVGIRDERAGAAMAAEAYERMREAEPDKDEYSVLLCNALPNNPAFTRRVNKDATSQGTAQRYLETRSDPSVSIYGGGGGSKILQIDPRVSGAETQISNTLGTDTVDAVLGSGYWAAVAAGRLKQNGDLPESTVTGGFDLDQRMIDSVRDGHTDFTLGQDPYNQGYRSVPLAWAYLERGMPMRDVEWGVCVYDEDNIDFADERRNWQELDQWQQDNYGFL